MRQSIIIILVLSSFVAFGQKRDKWQLSFQLQPELAFHTNNYAFRWAEKHTKATFNIGFGSLLQYNLTDRVFIEGGVAFISRKLKAKAFVDQSLLPPPYLDSTKILYIAKGITLRTLQLPLGAGMYIIKRNKTKVFVKANYIPDFLISAKYEVNDYPAFKKNYWQGYSLNTGFGADYQLRKKIILTSALSYSFVNTVKKDHYLFSQDESPIALPHTYLQLSTGVKINF